MLGPEDLKSEHFHVAPENWVTVELFIALSTQWNWMVGMHGARRTGLNYPAVESMLRLLKIKGKSKVFNGLLIMETAAMEVWNNG
jgi:hypothetical protein